MKKYIPLYYLLFILLVMGAFASMAQNSYGLKIMGIVSFLFGLIFIVELITIIRKKENKEMLQVIEPACLFVLSIILGLRIFFIYFPYVEWLFGAASILLMLGYLRKTVLRFRQSWPKNNLLAIFVLVFQLSIILFLISLATIPYAAKLSEISGALAFVLLVGFIFAGLLRKNFLVDGENVSAFKMVRGLKDHSVIMASLFLLFSFYLLFNKVGIVPGIYSDEFPKAYFELVDKAALGKEKPVDGKYQHEEFMKQYKLFIRDQKIAP